MNSLGWDGFWVNQKQFFNAVMKIGTTFFARQATERFKFKKSDEILDYGCGPGFLADYLASVGPRITGADINEYYLAQCRKNHPNSLFVKISTDPHINLKSFERDLPNKKFDFIILLSISQYFKDHSQLEEILEMLCLYVKPNGKIILADVVDSSTSSIRDALSLLYHCVINMKIKTYFMFMSYLLFSNYRKISSNVKLLRVPMACIAQIAEKNLLDCEKVEGLTIHSSRTNYVLTKKH